MQLRGVHSPMVSSRARRGTIKYKDIKFYASSRRIIDKANEFLDDYAQQGYSVTLRQLYYRFVSEGVIPNNTREYDKLGSIINDARLAGEISWYAISDRTRNLASWGGDGTPEQAIDAAANGYGLDMWTTQPKYVEVWVEKDALAGVINRACGTWSVPYFSCRGYTSQSEMWEAGQRLLRKVRAGKEPIIIHLGDHDPSGIDMTRDIDERLELFMGGLHVNRIALNMDQIDDWQSLSDRPFPPNPAKLTDSRANKYIDLYGDESWELDAIPPASLVTLIQNAIRPHIDKELWFERQIFEEQEKRKIKRISENYLSIQDYVTSEFGDDDLEVDPDDVMRDFPETEEDDDSDA